MKWKPRKCCLCYGVREGTITLGCVGLNAGTVIFLSLFAFSSFTPHDFVVKCYDFADLIRTSLNVASCADGAISFLSATGIASGLAAITNGLLIAGVMKNKPRLMIPYFVSQGITLVYLVVFALVFAVAFVRIGYGYLAFCSIVAFSVALFLQVYFSMVGYTCYLQVKQNSTNYTRQSEEMMVI